MHKDVHLFKHLTFSNGIALTANNFIWFALTFWAILQTGSVIVASLIAGIFSVTNMIGAIFFGTLVDHSKKKAAMLYSSLISLTAFSIATILYIRFDLSQTITGSDPIFWLFVVFLMIGTVAGNIRTIALSTLVTLLFTTNRDKANGLIGTMQGISFVCTSLFSGLVIGFLSMDWALFITICATAIALLYVAAIPLHEETVVVEVHENGRVDLRGTIAVIKSIPGLMALIFFTAFNNLLGGVFMALMDIYGLSLVSVQTWGFLWSAVSLVMIVSGMLVAKYGIGKQPLRTILLANIISWSGCIFFPLQPSVVLLIIGMVIWMFLFPIVEAAEQTLLQNTVPQERQGRVFGFAQSLESAASPLTAFIVGPITYVTFIPFMTTGAGVDILGSWFGTGPDRGIALVFITAGIIGALAAIAAFRSKSYRQLSSFYKEATEPRASQPL